MFIRRVKKQRSKDSKIFYQYMLAQTYRTEDKVKQRGILYLGSSPLLDDKDNRALVLQMLKSKIFMQEDIFPLDAPKELVGLVDGYFEKYCIKYGQPDVKQVSIPPAPERAEFHNVDIKGLEAVNVKSFGPEHLCKQVLKKLGLGDFFASLGMDKQEIAKALISIASRAIFSESEHKTSQILELNSELQLCFNHPQKITHKHLYTVADQLFNHKEQIDQFLFDRTTKLFGLTNKLVIFDISNTYFETRKPKSKLAKRGRSKEKRNDCPLVVFTGVINAEGFIRHSRIYNGNKPDSDTLSDMINDLEKYSSSTAVPTIVIDAGIATEDNLALITQKGYKYVCVARKRLENYPVDRSNPNKIQLTDRKKGKVELTIFTPDEFDDTWMYVRSEAKRQKEQSMDQQLKQRFEQDIATIEKAFHRKGGTKKINKVWERIGRAKQKHNRVSGQYQINVSETDGIATSLECKLKPIKIKTDKADGVYFIRTNHNDLSEGKLWDIYNTIREVESTFRCLKTDLNIRPVHHQNDSRIKSHIYLTILAYQLVNTIRHMLKSANIHHDWKNIVRIMKTHTIQTIVLPTDKKDIHLRKPSKPNQHVQQIYQATACTQVQSPTKKYVVYH